MTENIITKYRYILLVIFKSNLIIGCNISRYHSNLLFLLIYLNQFYYLSLVFHNTNIYFKKIKII